MIGQKFWAEGLGRNYGQKDWAEINAWELLPLTSALGVLHKGFRVRVKGRVEGRVC